MSELMALQQAFQALVVEGIDTPGLLAVGPAPLAPRVHTYQHAYRARLCAALQDNFPALAAALGDDAFAALAEAYIAHHPSRQPSIRWFGDELGSFCAVHPELVPHPALPDLARMEWALRAAFDAPDAQALDTRAFAELRAEDWPGLCLGFHPALQSVALQWAVEPLWQALNESPEAELDEPQPLPHRLLIWRVGLATRWRSLAEEEGALFDGARAGECFGHLCTLIPDEDGSRRAALALRQWVEEGLVCAIRQESDR